MATVNANGIELYYEVHGAGEPLLLIMGLGGTAATWDPQIPAFSREYQVIAFDNRGSGRSEMPAHPYSVHLMADDTAALMDELGIQTANVFGMSMGGMIAQELYHRHGARVRTLMLAGTMAGGPMATFPNAARLQQFAGVRAMLPAAAVEAGLSFFYSEEFIARNKQRLIKRALEQLHLVAPAQSLQKQLMAVLGFNAHGRLHNIRVPTLVMGGTEDKIVPFKNQEMLAKHIPDARFVTFHGAGHGFLFERAEAVNRAVLSFLGEHRTHFVSAK
ncbi:MAG: alpha/beta fold hydrolase [Dehalococcoidia bacterium]